VSDRREETVAALGHLGVVQQHRHQGDLAHRGRPPWPERHLVRHPPQRLEGGSRRFTLSGQDLCQ
jgi:hypothetical protein